MSEILENNRNDLLRDRRKEQEMWSLIVKFDESKCVLKNTFFGISKIAILWH